MKHKVLVGVIFIAFLTGCGSTNTTDYKADYKGYTRYFRTISDEINGEIVYDTRTGVEYWKSSSAYNYGNLTLLVDADGKPLIYDRSEEK